MHPSDPHRDQLVAHRESPTDDTVRTSLDGKLSGIRHRVSSLHALLDGFTQHESHPLRGAGVRDALRETLAELERHLTAVLEMVADRRELTDLHEQLTGVWDHVQFASAYLDGFVRGTTRALTGDRVRGQLYDALLAVDYHLERALKLGTPEARAAAGPVPASIARW